MAERPQRRRGAVRDQGAARDDDSDDGFEAMLRAHDKKVAAEESNSELSSSSDDVSVHQEDDNPDDDDNSGDELVYDSNEESSINDDDVESISNEGSVASQGQASSSEGSVASQGQASSSGSVASQGQASSSGSVASQGQASSSGSVASQGQASSSGSVASQGQASSSGSVASQGQASSSGSAASQGSDDSRLPQALRDRYLRLYIGRGGVLDRYGILYIHELSLPQLMTLAEKFMKSSDVRDLRPREVQEQIDAYHELYGPDSRHPQEDNELCVMVDYIIKTKCIIESIKQRLESGDPRFLVIEVPNSDFDGECIPDVFVFLPAELRYQICQGTAFQHFGGYHDYDDHVKHLDFARYIMGLFSARLYDTNAAVVGEDGCLLSVYEEDEEILHYDEEGVNIDVFRQVKATAIGSGAFELHLYDPTAEVSRVNHVVRLHRLVLILANQLELTVFTDGNLQAIGLIPPGRDWDYSRQINAYNGWTRHAGASVPYDGETSSQCDGDHYCGASAIKFCHGIACVIAVGHQTNTRNIYVRRNAGHWCYGLVLSRYVDGTTTSDRIYRFIDRITYDDGGVPHFDGQPIEDTDVLQLLPDVDEEIE